MSEDNSAITLTIKVEGGPSSPWLVLRSNDPNQAQQQLDAIAASGLADALGRAHAAVNAGFNAGNVLGARAEGAPVGNGFANAPAQALVAQQQYAQQAAQPAPSQYQAAQAGPQHQQQYQQYQQPAAPATPGAPLVMGQPAKLYHGTTKAGKPYDAWVDPRPKEVTDGMESTKDVNDPGLQNGTKKLFAFLR